MAKECRGDRPRIKIAILDTGILRADICRRLDSTKAYRTRQGFGNDSDPIKECKSFISSDVIEFDTCGHGTQIACLLLEFAPDADLYIAKVSAGMNLDEPIPVAEALRWAAKEVRADIITMSFGWDYHIPEVNTAIEDVLAGRTEQGHQPLLIASASNNGLRTSLRSFPAWDERLICAYALDGNGADTSTLNPPRMDNRHNFGTLGHGVRVYQGRDIIYKSGTSYATPFLAAIVANHLGWLDHHASRLGDAKYRIARKKQWVEHCLGTLMVTKPEPHSRLEFVAPWHFFTFNGHRVRKNSLTDEVSELDKQTDEACQRRLWAKMPTT